ncbi:MAG: IS110 family transposase, partial [Actinomycetia bacterium]|nr:IS110 family transposase [Actinomycetes bacterium]
YDTADKNCVKAKGSIHIAIKELFPDFNMKKDFIFGTSGNALMEKYSYNPFCIDKSGKNRFKAVMKRAVPRIKHMTIDKIFNSAKASIQNQLSPRYIKLLELELKQHWQDLKISLDRKQQAKAAMEILYEQACLYDSKLPRAYKGVITTFHLARIIAETGPLSDFDSWRKLMRFAGFNLC